MLPSIVKSHFLVSKVSGYWRVCKLGTFYLTISPVSLPSQTTISDLKIQFGEKNIRLKTVLLALEHCGLGGMVHRDQQTATALNWLVYKTDSGGFELGLSILLA